MSDVKRVCKGPIVFGDQGIEQCFADGCNGGCLCCDLVDLVDHSTAEYECFTHPITGICALRVHDGRDCTKPKATP
jgi:hypothetical protein